MKWAVFAFGLFLPISVHADVASFVFTSAVQTVAPNQSTEQITLEAQDASGAAVSGSTICIRVSSSGTGFFSTNTSWSDPVSSLTLTLSSNQSRRNFYYKGSSSGSHTITAQAAMRPEGTTCTQWSPDMGVTWSAAQIVTVSGGASEQQQQSTQTSGGTDTSTTTQKSPSTSQGSIVSSYVPPPEPSIYADAGDDRSVIVGADTVFRARAYNKQREYVENARFSWNFGDGTTGEGATIVHHYSYPGRYAIVLSIAQGFESASDRFIVSADPASISFTSEPDGSVVIANTAGKDLNLSKWIVRAFFREFVIPDDTIILAGASLQISPKTLGYFAGAETELAYPNGTLALRAGQAQQAPIAVAGIKSVAPSTPPPQAAAKAPSAVSERVEPVDDSAPTSTSASSTQVAAAANSIETNFSYWWLAALALAAVTGAGVMALRRMASKEWTIIEESDDTM